MSVELSQHFFRRVRAEFKSSWKSAISSFAKLFLAETPGMERDCFLAEHAGSAGRIARFVNVVSNHGGFYSVPVFIIFAVEKDLAER